MEIDDDVTITQHHVTNPTQRQGQQQGQPQGQSQPPTLQARRSPIRRNRQLPTDSTILYSDKLILLD